MYTIKNKDAIFSKKYLIMFFFSINFFLFCAIFTVKNFVYAISSTAIISVMFLTVFIFYIRKKDLNLKDYYLIYGLLGVSTSFAFALLTAICKGNSFFQTIIILFVISAILLILFVIFEFVSKRFKSNKHKPYPFAVRMSLAAIGATAGLVFARFFPIPQTESGLEFVLFCGSLLFSIFYLLLIKYKDEKNSVDSLKQSNKSEQSGDGSMIDG